MAEFHLRSAKQTDGDAIRALIHRVGINPFGLAWNRFVVAESCDSLLIGCGQLKPHKDGSIELASIAVEEPYRGQGIARAMIEYLLARAPRPLYLMCRPALGGFYAQFNFRAAGEDELPPYFRRIRRVVRVAGVLTRKEGPLIMWLDEETSQQIGTQE